MIMKDVPLRFTRAAGASSCVLTMAVYAAATAALLFQDQSKVFWQLAVLSFLLALGGIVCGAAGWRTETGRAGLLGSVLYLVLLLLLVSGCFPG